MSLADHVPFTVIKRGAENLCDDEEKAKGQTTTNTNFKRSLL